MHISTQNFTAITFPYHLLSRWLYTIQLLKLKPRCANSYTFFAAVNTTFTLVDNLLIRTWSISLLMAFQSPEVSSAKQSVLQNLYGLLIQKVTVHISCIIPGLKIITTFDWLKPRVYKTHILGCSQAILPGVTSHYPIKYCYNFQNGDNMTFKLATLRSKIKFS